MQTRSIRRMLAATLIGVSGLAIPAAVFPDTYADALQEGKSLLQAERYDEAILAFAQAAESQDPETSKFACAYAGFCYQQKGDFDQTIRWYERAQKEDPRFLGVLERLSGVYFTRRNDYSKGMEIARKAEALWSRAPGVYYNIACFYALEGRADLALSYIDKAFYNGYSDLAYVASDPDFEPVRSVEPFKRFFPSLGSIAAGGDLLERAAQKLQTRAYDEVIQLGQDALARYAEALGTDSLTVAAILSNVLGETYAAAEQRDAAIACFEKSLAIQLRVLGTQHPDVATSLGTLGSVYYSNGEYDLAVDYGEKALAIRLQALGEEHADTATSYNNLGVVYGARGEEGREIGCYEKALAIRLKVLGEQHPDTATSYNNLGMVYHEKGEYDRAIGFFRKALAIRLKVQGEGHAEVARSYESLGSVYQSMGEYDRAGGHYEKALAILLAASGEGHPDVAQLYDDLSALYRSKGEYDKAIANAERALAIWMKAYGEQHPAVADGYNTLGLAYQKKGDDDRAISSHQNALTIRLKALGDKHFAVAMSYTNLGDAYKSRGDYERAIACYEHALAISEAAEYCQLSIITALFLGRANLECSRHAEAKKAFLRGISAIEAGRREAGVSKVEFSARTIDLYYLSLQASAALGDMSGVFEAAEGMRARSFLDRLSLSAALSADGVPPETRRKMLALNDELESLAARRSAEIQKPEALQDTRRLLGIVNALEQREKEFVQLDNALMGDPRYQELRMPELASLPEAQRMLGKDEAILEYVLLEQGTEREAHCLVIRRSGAELVELDTSYAFAQNLADYREAILDGSPKRRLLEEELYAKVVGPVEGKLPGVKKLIIVPDGALAFLPFDALRKNGSSPYLCENYQVSLAPSVSVLRMVAKRTYGSRVGRLLAIGGARYSAEGSAAQRGRRGLVLARPSREETRELCAAEGPREYYRALGYVWDDLPGTRDEVLAIAQGVYGSKGTRVLMGEQASERQVKELSTSGELAQQTVVHFACHGVYDAEYPAYSAVVLSEVSGALEGTSPESGYLTVEDVALLKLRADLVNLSACETGLGKLVQGDGVIGLTRAFLVAGANQVGATLWVVDDMATKEFMTRLYALVETKKLSYRDAIVKVKREFIHDSRYSDPYFWGGFVLYGK